MDHQHSQVQQLPTGKQLQEQEIQQQPPFHAQQPPFHAQQPPFHAQQQEQHRFRLEECGLLQSHHEQPQEQQEHLHRYQQQKFGHTQQQQQRAEARERTDKCNVMLPACGCIPLMSGGGVFVDGKREEKHRIHAELFVFDPDALRLVSRCSPDSLAREEVPVSHAGGSAGGNSKNWSSCTAGSSSSTITSSSIESRRSSDRDSSSSDDHHYSSSNGCRLNEELCTSWGRSTPQTDQARSNTSSSNISSGKSGSSSNSSADNSSTTSGMNSSSNSSTSGNNSSGSSSHSSSNSSNQKAFSSFVDLVFGRANEVFLRVEWPLTGVVENIPLRSIFRISDDLVLCCSSRDRGPPQKQQRAGSSAAVATSVLQTPASSSSSLTSAAVDGTETAPVPFGGRAALAAVAAPVLCSGSSHGSSAKAVNPHLPNAAAAGRCAPGAPIAADVAAERSVCNSIALCGRAEAVPSFDKGCIFAMRFATGRAADAFVTHATRYFSHRSSDASGCDQTKSGRRISSPDACPVDAACPAAVTAVPPTDVDSAAAAAAACAARSAFAAVAVVEEEAAVDCSADRLKDDSFDTTRRRKSLKKNQQQDDGKEQHQQQQPLDRQHEQPSGGEQPQHKAEQLKTCCAPTGRSQDPQQLRGAAGQQKEEAKGGTSALLPAAAASSPLQLMDAGAVDNYFHYYGKLSNQMNILQDTIRTAAYYKAIMSNKVDFEGKVVMDVGAGSGILSFFAAQAGAKKVYAVEASRMAATIDLLCRKNPHIGRRIVILHACVEQLSSTDVPEKVDALVSEPLGTFLFNERMIETYLIARDRFLKPGGKMYPSRCVLAVAPFTDAALYQEFLCKADMWKQHKFFGIDISAAHATAVAESFRQPVVDLVDPALLVAPAHRRMFDWRTLTVDVLKDIYLPLQYVLPAPAVLHGLAASALLRLTHPRTGTRPAFFSPNHSQQTSTSE